MAKKLFTVTDLGGGDGGKGGVVHKICTEMNAHTVIKVGGAQGSHGVATSRGFKFNFSQFGCGTFEGVKTHLTQNFVIDPNGIMNEAELLKYGCGVRNSFEYLTVDENAISATPWHQAASRLRELARRDNPRGTIGTGVGEAFLDAERYPKLAIRAKDIKGNNLYRQLEAVRMQKIAELAEITANNDCFLESDRDSATELIELLHFPGLIQWTYDRFKTMASSVRIVESDYLEKEVLERDGVVVVESSHGVLTDRYYGFHPHTSKLRTIPAETTFNLLKECGYDGEVIKLGVTRAYQIRHGAGPMVTECSEMLENLLPGSNKNENRWQGKVRVGPLDFVALRYAVNVCGGPDAFDGIAVTWFDQIIVNGAWKMCDSYNGAHHQHFFEKGDILVRRGADEHQLAHQGKLGELLRMCRPNCTAYLFRKNEKLEYMIELCERVFTQELKVPVKMISFGPTEDDKICL
ncbi:MAG: adenylosuccinate synthetase [Candidatus Sungbacteria bacterium]|nr:adenylosuccinate synthetase [Candidatus Sungbacteria bacterium]